MQEICIALLNQHKCRNWCLQSEHSRYLSCQSRSYCIEWLFLEGYPQSVLRKKLTEKYHISLLKKYEPRHEETNNVISEHV